MISTKSNERSDPRFGRNAYREHNRIERLINNLKQFRRIATRYEKRAVNYLTKITIATILLWLCSLPTRPKTPLRRYSGHAGRKRPFLL